MKKGERLEISISWVLKGKSAPDELVLGLATEALKKLRLATPNGTFQRLCTGVSIGPVKRVVKRFHRRRKAYRRHGHGRVARSPFPQCESEYDLQVPFLETSLKIQCVLDRDHPGDHHAMNFSWRTETPPDGSGRVN
jgi:hypothetical protein